MARYGHIEWRKEVAYSHQVATNFARKDKLQPRWPQVLGP
jgi:hypothetical protein